MVDQELRRSTIKESVGNKVNHRHKPSVPFSVYINLFIILSALLQTQCCTGFLLNDAIDWRRPIPRLSCLDRKKKSRIHSSHDFEYSPKSKSKFQKDGVAYRQSVCTQQEMESIEKEISLIMKHHLSKERSSIAQNRFGATLSRDNAGDTIEVLEKGSMCKLVQRLVDDSQNKIELAREIPVEVRLYEQVGASMAWHQDDVMYDPPQLEVVFTIENNSDCVTMWKKQVGNEKSNDEIHSQETHPNSMILLLAGGPDHCVTSLKRGRRVILKCAYVYEGATYVGEEDCNQFGKAKGNANSKRKSKKRKR